jgi:hypothetical protein
LPLRSRSPSPKSGAARGASARQPLCQCAVGEGEGVGGNVTNGLVLTISAEKRSRFFKTSCRAVRYIEAGHYALTKPSALWQVAVGRSCAWPLRLLTRVCRQTQARATQAFPQFAQISCFTFM